jgi:hypothetical protein
VLSVVAVPPTCSDAKGYNHEERSWEVGNSNDTRKE